MCTNIATAQRITTIHLDGVQYFISRMNPYSPELNYFLAYQYCRSLGLQLASFETKEKAESMTTYLKNAGYGNYDFWTSGNRLGTGMFLWMSTGLPRLLDPVDHNSNTSPQRTARDSSSGAEKGCVILKQPTLKWTPEDCSAVKDFICEQTRCYYYNYGQYSSVIGAGPSRHLYHHTPHRRRHQAEPIHHTVTTYPRRRGGQDDEHEHEHDEHDEHEHEHEHDAFDADDEEVDAGDDKKRTLPVYEGNNNDLHIASKESAEQQLTHDVAQLPDVVDDDDEETANDENNASASHEDGAEETADSKINTVGEDQLKTLPVPAIAAPAEVPTVEVRLKQISQEIEKMAAASNENQRHNLPTAGLLHHENNNNDVDRQSFLSLTDLIRTLRPNNKQIIPQIDSDYSNAMRVLGETSEVVNNEEAHKF
ncbi:unnamed protein product [Ceratitis capitata]|uniref:(Mediterranean fruit fly) hypothetical protein n=1 Tax=Ceratitis capitata TaxID=7213 RepID=A0A811VAT3_CERCA|nr:unnamed protein product [Ceratitis capitata]